ncbi:MAG TPA: tRNA-uridine aminocarboxypropyltransferase [Bdellovibrionota bacterium]|jgi:DTW domain-containing protein YfiP|nr:tRNA-uridine aminocarboxypropyltransferase [Bdellovibrionota bacterium]
MTATSGSRCVRCRRGGGTCYCARIRPFDPGFELVFIAHPREARNSVGTLRIAHLSTPGSHLLVGCAEEIDRDPRIMAFARGDDFSPWLLYPGEGARPPRQAAGGSDRRLALFVIDGTWSQAKSLVRDSRILSSLPRVGLDPFAPSEYVFRRQPQAHCLSTVEAVHALIEGLHGAGAIALPPERAHDGMLEVFRAMVRVQIERSVARQQLGDGDGGGCGVGSAG